jgi:putative MATE family efflux protein
MTSVRGDWPDSSTSSSESEFEAVEAAEMSPALPSATLAAGAAPTEAAPAARDGYREIWTLSWPVMLAQVLANAVSLIDIAMVGRLGPEAVAAVGYATQFFFLSQSLLFAVGFACVALMARAIGASDPDRARHALAASIGVAVTAALCVMAAVLAAPAALLRLLGAEEAVVSLAVPYLELMLGASVLLAVSMIIESGLRADRNTRLPMQIAVVITGVKTLLNFGLIFGAFGLPRLELVGAGLATVASQAIGLGLFAAVVARAKPGTPIALRPADFTAARPLLSDVIRISLPSIGERLAMNLALLAYFRILAGYGTVAIAAYTVGIRVLSFSWIPGIGFGTAAATLVGQALGAGNLRGAREAGWRATRAAPGRPRGRLARHPRGSRRRGQPRGRVRAGPHAPGSRVHRRPGDDRHTGALPPVPGPRPALPPGSLRPGRGAPRRRRHLDAVRRLRTRQLGAARAAGHPPRRRAAP